MSAPMQAGKLRRKLVIQSPGTTPDGYGHVAGDPTTVLTTWGQVTVKPQNTLLAAIAGKVTAQSQYAITIRFPPSVAISPNMLVVDGSKTYRIHQVADVDERHRMLTLLCEEMPA